MGIINNFFGMILNAIFEGVANVVPVGTLGVTIIIFTLVVQLLMTPLKIKQQRTTRAMSRIQPELQKIQKKYANKKDQESQMKYSQEMNVIYKKHKISPFSGCLPLIIQLPLIYALFNVLRNPSTHITKLNVIYQDIATLIINKVVNYQSLFADMVKNVTQRAPGTYDLTSVTKTASGSGFSDFLSHVGSQQWSEILAKVPADVQTSLTQLVERKNEYEWFMVNLVDTPAQLISNKVYLAILVPIIAGASTFIFSKITMASTSAMQQTSAEGPSQTETMMKTMNFMMPIMTGTFAYTMPVGLALYWISGNLIMMVQQIFVNKLVSKQEAVIEEQLRKEREASGQVVKKKKRKKPPTQTEQVQEGTDKASLKADNIASEDQSTKESDKEED